MVKVKQLHLVVHSIQRKVNPSKVLAEAASKI